MPLDILKLDMKFIQSETAKPINQGILRFIMGLARWMNLSVVAEGVETKEQLERLREIGCDYVQGYYFAKPMPCEAFESLLQQLRCTADSGPARQNRLLLSQPDQALLIADEDEEYRKEVRNLFEERFQILEAADGESALEYINNFGHKIAAAVLSMTLSRSDGSSLMEILPKKNAIWNMAIIATAPADKQLEEKALELGADDFAGKPHSTKSLWRRVMRSLGIAATQERERILQEEAYRDYLTGLLNRRGLDAAVSALRKEDAPLAFYLFDLDNLKKVNDTFGHIKGDLVIKRFSEVLREHTRNTDILARIGGDEFVVILKQIRSREDVLNKGEEICRSLQETGTAHRVPSACTAGIVLWDVETPMDDIIAQADQALYTAKSNNKGGCCL